MEFTVLKITGIYALHLFIMYDKTAALNDSFGKILQTTHS
jgi:hypothetical protein